MGGFLFAVTGVLLVVLAHVPVTEAQTEKNLTVGEDLQLSPQQVSEQIYSIVWKYNRNLLAEWVKDSIDLTYYSTFRGRSELNTDTGELVVRKVTAGDTGVYSVEINNRVQSRVHQIRVFQKVPQPVVEVQPLVCTEKSDNCTLVCHGVTANAEPVEYFWKKDDGEWGTAGNLTMVIINNKETWPVRTFSCRMKNPVSQKESKPTENPFYRETPEPESSATAGIIAAVIVVLIVLIVVGALIAYLKNTKFKNLVDGCLTCKKHSDQPSSADPKNNGELDQLNKANPSHPE